MPQKLFLFSEVVFEDPPKIPFKNKHTNNLARLFLFFEVIFCLARLLLKNSLMQKILRANIIISEQRTGNIAKRRLLVNPYGPEVQTEFCCFSTGK